MLYGSDGLASVINLTTRHGFTTVPEITYSADGGNFSTLREDGTIGGAYHAFDYFSEFARFDTRNQLPNNGFHNGTYAGNFGWKPTGATELRFTARHTAVGFGDSNAIGFLRHSGRFPGERPRLVFRSHPAESDHSALAQSRALCFRPARLRLNESFPDGHAV